LVAVDISFTTNREKAMGLKISEKRVEDLLNQGKFFLEVIDQESMTTLMKWMGDNITRGKREFTLLISSSGGSATWAIQFASFLRMVPGDVRLHGIAIGECGSAALAVLQFCHRRTALRHTAFFPHHVQCTLKINCQQSMEEIMASVEREVAQSRLIERELVLIQSKRIGITADEWMQIAEYGEQLKGGIKYLTDDALRLGMIDEVIERYPLIE
jgi:ATP-dependent protease ClpP protease subunit